LQRLKNRGLCYGLAMTPANGRAGGVTVLGEDSQAAQTGRISYYSCFLVSAAGTGMPIGLAFL
jgi:hypothetical protein